MFVGDLVDRGPRSPDVLRIAMHMEETGSAYVIQGNHDRKLFRWLDGRNVTIGHGLQQSIDQLLAEDDAFRSKAKTFLDSLRSHAWLDGGKLAVAHAGLKEEMIGRGSGAVREFALFGETTGEMDEFGLPVRRDWASEYRGDTVGDLRPCRHVRNPVGEQHALHRHGLRLRRQAHRLALAREADRQRAGGEGLLRTCPARLSPRPAPRRRSPTIFWTWRM